MSLAAVPSLLSAIGSMTGIAVQKATAIIGDDVAANTNQLMGLQKGRTLQALKTVVRGSLLNKAALVPAALLVSWAAPWAVLPLLAVGGLHLASEGVEKIISKSDATKKPASPQEEKEKIAGALKIDLILSAEITVLTLSVVAGAPFLAQMAVLAGTGLAMTGVLYSLVGGLVGMGDAGRWLQKREGTSPAAKAARAVGNGLTKAMPYIMKGVSLVGTAALFTIGGSLLLHGIPGGGALLAKAASLAPAMPFVQGLASVAASTAVGFAAGLVAFPVREKLEKPVEKLVDAVKTKLAKIFTKKQKPVNGNKPAPAPEAAPQALQNVSDVKSALNTAAVPAQPANDAAKPPVSAPKIAP